MVMFQTSGSTGTPKVVQKTQASLVADAMTLAATFKSLFETRPTFVASIQTHHMYGKLWLETLQPLTKCDRHLEVVDSWETLLQAQAQYASILFVTTPSFLAELVAQRQTFTPLRNVAAIVTSGSLLRPELSAAVCDLFGVSPIEIYGSTETGSIAWRQQQTSDAWTLFEGVEAKSTAEGTLSVVSPFCVTTPYTLQDCVAFLDARHLLLHGRKDRYVKILEHLVALAEIEDCVRQHPYVETCVALASTSDVARVWMMVVPSQEGREVLVEKGYQSVTRALRLALSETLPTYAVPRKIRFVRALPYTAQGKLPVAALLPAFESERQAPITFDWSVQAETLTTTFSYPQDALFFQGHFPGAPILPGVAQLFTVRQAIQAAFGVKADGSIKRLKFQQPILPKQKVTLTVTRQTTNTFVFAITSSQGPCASGVLTIREG